MKRMEKSPFVDNVAALFGAANVLRLSHAAVHLHVQLLSLMNGAGWPEAYEVSDRMLALQLGMSTRTLAAARQELVDAGIVAAEPVGSGNQMRMLYRLLPEFAQLMRQRRWGIGGVRGGVAPAAMPDGSTAVGASFKGSGAGLKTGDRETRQEEREGREERAESGDVFAGKPQNADPGEGDGESVLALEGWMDFMMGRREWVAEFCRNNGLTEEKLRRHVEQFVRQQRNQGVRMKERGDLLRHFGAWYSRLDMARFRQQEEEADRRQRWREAAEEERREAERRAEEKERESWASFMRTVERQRQKAAEGDEYAIEWLEKMHKLKYI